MPVGLFRKLGSSGVIPCESPRKPKEQSSPTLTQTGGEPQCLRTGGRPTSSTRLLSLSPSSLVPSPHWEVQGRRRRPACASPQPGASPAHPKRAHPRAGGCVAAASSGSEHVSWEAGDTTPLTLPRQSAEVSKASADAGLARAPSTAPPCVLSPRTLLGWSRARGFRATAVPAKAGCTHSPFPVSLLKPMAPVRGTSGCQHAALFDLWGCWSGLRPPPCPHCVASEPQVGNEDGPSPGFPSALRRLAGSPGER